MNGVQDLKDDIGLLKFPKTGKFFSVDAQTFFFDAFLLLLCRVVLRLFRQSVPPGEDWCIFVINIFNRKTIEIVTAKKARK